MLTYKYRFPIKTENLILEDPKAFEQSFTSMLMGSVEYYEVLMGLNEYSEDGGEILHHAEIEAEEHVINAVELYTSRKLYQERKGQIMDYVQETFLELADNMGENIEELEFTNMEDLGISGFVPEKLYHITEHSNLNSILKNGLIPQQGGNSYKTYKNAVYLTEEQDIPIWLGSLEEFEEPVLLQIDTKDLNLKTGRYYKDRVYLQSRNLEAQGFGEYRSLEPIPPDKIKPLDMLDDENIKLAERLKEAVNLFKKNVYSESEKEELEQCQSQLDKMGVYDEKLIKEFSEGINSIEANIHSL